MKKTVPAPVVPKVSGSNAAMPDVGSVLGVGAHVDPAKPAEFDEAGNKILARLTPDQYWEWRTTAAELQLAERELDIAIAQATILGKEMEIAHLRTALHGSTAMSKARAKKEAAEVEYHRFRTDLEGRIGTTLADKVIDETFAVKDLNAVESKEASTQV